MARGGMYDQLGGGFARYSVDASWVVPHFEKMLYDNALLARVYAHLWRRTGSELARRVAAETCDWMIRELRTPRVVSRPRSTPTARAKRAGSTSGRLASLRRAWRRRRRYAAEAFGVAECGTFEHGSSVLQYRRDTADPERLRGIRSALLAARGARVRPDATKRSSLPGTASRSRRWQKPACCLPGPIWWRPPGRGPAARRTAPGRRAAGTDLARRQPGAAGVLEDYACVAEGLLTLAGVTGEARWVMVAGNLIERRLTGSATATAASMTRPMTPNACCTGRKTRRTTRLLPAGSRRRVRC